MEKCILLLSQLNISQLQLLFNVLVMQISLQFLVNVRKLISYFYIPASRVFSGYVLNSILSQLPHLTVCFWTPLIVEMFNQKKKRPGRSPECADSYSYTKNCFRGKQTSISPFQCPKDNCCSHVTIHSQTCVNRFLKPQLSLYCALSTLMGIWVLKECRIKRGRQIESHSFLLISLLFFCIGFSFL